MAFDDRLQTVLADKYLIERFIGSGGMSLVYAATHLRSYDRVAIKFLRPELLGEEDSLDRIEKEARAVARLRHPNIVRLMDVDTAPTHGPYLVFELLQGESLEELVQRETALSFGRAYTLLRPIMDALAHAHRQGLIHRDVKPANVFIARDPDGTLTPKLLDFGLVRGLDDRIGIRTKTGQVVGTPCQMSPEQAHGVKELGPVTDVWSMGVTLYRVLSGVGPFDRETLDATVLAVAVGEYLPLTRRCPQLVSAGAIQRVLDGALEVDADARTPDMPTLMAQLDAALAPATPLRPRARPSLPPATEASIEPAPAVAAASSIQPVVIASERMPALESRSRSWLTWLSLLAVGALLLALGVLWSGLRRDPLPAPPAVQAVAVSAPAPEAAAPRAAEPAPPREARPAPPAAAKPHRSASASAPAPARSDALEIGEILVPKP